MTARPVPPVIPASPGRRPGRPGAGRPMPLASPCHSAMPPVTSSAGRARWVRAACWCARITVESALTVQSLPSARFAVRELADPHTADHGHGRFG